MVLKRISILVVLLLSVSFIQASPPSGWPGTLHGESEFMIFVHRDFSKTLYKIKITIEQVSGTKLYTGSTLKMINNSLTKDNPYTGTKYLTVFGGNKYQLILINNYHIAASVDLSRTIIIVINKGYNVIITLL